MNGIHNVVDAVRAPRESAREQDTIKTV